MCSFSSSSKVIEREQYAIECGMEKWKSYHTHRHTLTKPTNTLLHALCVCAYCACEYASNSFWKCNSAITIKLLFSGGEWARLIFFAFFSARKWGNHVKVFTPIWNSRNNVDGRVFVPRAHWRSHCDYVENARLFNVNEFESKRTNARTTFKCTRTHARTYTHRKTYTHTVRTMKKSTRLTLQ